jgi:hypothetical protein
MRHQEFGLITLGQPHPHSLDGEGAEFTWCGGWLEFTLTFKDPSPSEQQVMETGVFEVALNVVEQIPFLCFRIFQVESSHLSDQANPAILVLPWQECPFHLVQVPPERLPAFDYVIQNPNFGLPIAVVLTDLATARVRALQQFTLSPFFSCSLVNALLNTFPCFTRQSYPAAVDRVFAQHPLNTIGDSARIRCCSGVSPVV